MSFEQIISANFTQAETDARSRVALMGAMKDLTADLRSWSGLVDDEF